MVTAYEEGDGGARMWVLQPTRSMTWSQAKRFVAAVAAVSFAIGGFFWLLGMPTVLPFSGLEALAVAVAFYVVLRDGERREVIRFDGDQLVIERGTRTVETRYEFNRYWVRVELAGPRSRLHPQRLLIGAHGRKVEIGRFLTDGERESFAGMLINALKKNR
ncbi:MAG: DUF2244 domain-containing protein [Gammaproteobacteria bacterium]|nr:DUF2244 domain-containing protein [Gammaproteobacteria bacterium]MCP5200547.1 DUF2244 domain-containing protein [Gammaproteobacteria bacterium]